MVRYLTIVRYLNTVRPERSRRVRQSEAKASRSARWKASTSLSPNGVGSD